MNAIFLDIDGVLNTPKSKSHCGIYLGIDKSRAKILAAIVEATNSELILTSTWKLAWEPYGNYTEPQESHWFQAAKYLDNHLKAKAGLKIKDKTREKNFSSRGAGILSYLNTHPEITNWVVLDDELFQDYSYYNQIMQHLVLTIKKYGLTEEDADAAIKILTNQTTGPWCSIWPECQSIANKEPDLTKIFS